MIRCFKALQIVTFSLVWASLAGCQSSAKRACAERDWFELGRRDGVAGRRMQSDSTKKVCSGVNNDDALVAYTTGYNSGLAEYCLPENGYAIGRTAAALAYVCPAPLDAPFLEAFARGQEATRLEQMNTKIDRQISSLNQKIKSAENKEELRGQISTLQTEKEQNKKKLGEIERRVQ